MEIKEARKTKHGYNIVINDEIYNIERAVFFKYGLKKGIVLKESLFKQILEESKLDLIKRKSLNYLVRRRTTTEFKEYLKKQEAPNYFINDLVAEYTKKGYLNDRLYAEIFISSQKDKYGKNRIKLNLIKKGIDNIIIDELLANHISDNIEELIKVAVKNVKARNYNHAFNKLMQSFIRKGYDIKEVKPYLEKHLVDVSTNETELKKDFEDALKRYKKRYEGNELKQNIIIALQRRGYNLKDILKLVGGM